MAGMKETLTKKAGPLPVWVWAAGVVGILALYLLHRQSQSAKTPSNAGTSAAANQTNLGSGLPSNLVPTAFPMPYSGGDTFVNVTQGSVGSQTVNDGDQEPGHHHPGPPPPPNHPPPPPAPPPPPTKKPAQTVTVMKWPNNPTRDTLWGIAQSVYGNGALWPRIYAANKALIGPDPNLIQPGMKLVIPR